MAQFTHDTYLSPLTWRYGSAEMRSLFSEKHRRTLFRRFWIALAKAEQDAGLVKPEQTADLIAHKDDIDIDAAARWEEVLHHDLMAEIKTYAAQCPVGGAIIHLGATSMDVEDNADALRLTEALGLLIKETASLLSAFVDKMEEYAAVPCMAFTHIQPAEPTTIGYRFAQTAQDLTQDLEDLIALRGEIRGKGVKGAVGTSASYQELLAGTGMSAQDLEDKVMAELGIKAFDAATQVYPRKQDLRVGEVLMNLSSTLSRFSLDFRLLMSPPIGEWSEPFGKKQVGSSAMPFKRNPINCEKVCSLGRYVESLVNTLWQNSSAMILERTLDDSANRRLAIPALFLSVEEMVLTLTKVVKGMVIHMPAVKRNMATYGIFAASERLLMELGRRGADRQAMHEAIREESLKAWDAVQSGQDNPLEDLLARNQKILAFMDEKAVRSCLDASQYVGLAPERTQKVARRAKAVLAQLEN